VINDKPSALSYGLSGLCTLLERKIALFKDFMSATVSLKDMLEIHNVEAVEMVIAKRRDYIAFIDGVDEEIRRFREENPSYEAKITPEIRKRLRLLTKTLEDVITEIMQLNQDCDAVARDELDRLRTDLSGLGHSQTWFRSYRGNAAEPRFLDVET